MMKDKTNGASKSNRYSEVLNGKRPKADAQLLRDILGADAGNSEKPEKSRAPRPPAVSRKRHDAHAEAKPTHMHGATQWD